MLDPVRWQRPVWASLVVAGALACRGDGGVPPPLAPANTDKDDGHGVLTRLTTQFSTGDDDGSGIDDAARNNRGGDGGDGYGGDLYGGDPYGGDLYGGLAYGGANWRPPAPHPLRYEVHEGLVGSIEGSVTWHGAPPAKIATACGMIDNPSVRITGNAVGGALVYIESVRVGRSTATYTKAAQVGGVVAKRGCALLPAAQVVAPLPAAFSIHGDAHRARLRVTSPDNAVKTVELQEAGLAEMETQTGVTRIDGADGAVTSAWLVGLDTPYFAITDDTGHFQIDELADGDYDVTIWQAPVATAGSNGGIGYGAPVIVHRRVHVAGTRPARLDVALGR
jgi:hypothetical protein